MQRIDHQLGADGELTRLAMVWALTTRGVPQILYGTTSVRRLTSIAARRDVGAQRE